MEESGVEARMSMPKRRVPNSVFRSKVSLSFQINCFNVDWPTDVSYLEETVLVFDFVKVFVSLYSFDVSILLVSVRIHIGCPVLC